MNFQQLKQQLQHNLWFGESERKKNLAHHLSDGPFLYRSMAVALVMPDQSKVWGLDISHWNIPPVDLRRMIDLYSLDFVIIKGCDGTLTAKYFADHKANAKACGIPWGTYCWLYPNNKISIDAQTTAWANQYLADPPPMGVFIDAEWTYYGGQPANPMTADLRSAHDKFKAKTGKKATTYTAPGYASSYLIGFDWSKEELWIANYGVSSPNLPAGATTYNLWQFTSTLDGHQLDPAGNAELDGNYYKGTHEQFAARYGVATEPPPQPPADVVTTPCQGMQRISGVRHGWKFELFVNDPAKVRFESVCLSPLETVSSVRSRKGATLGVNGGEWDRVASTKDYTVSNGVVCKARVQAVPSLVILENNFVGVVVKNILDVRQALSGLRHLIINGVIQPYLDGNEPQYTEGHARSIHGITSPGSHMVLQSEGVYPNQGLTLKQAAEIMLSYGAMIAFDSGGGGDVSCNLNGQSLIVPENVLPDGTHFERRLPNVFLIYAEPNEGEPMPGTAVSHTHNLSLRPKHQTIESSTILSIPMNTVVPVSETWTAPETTAYNNKDDFWCMVTYSGHTGWVGLKHLGVVYGIYTPPATEPPPTGTNPRATVTFTDTDGEIYEAVDVELKPKL